MDNKVSKLDYLTFSQYLPVKFTDEDNRFTKLGTESLIYSLTTRILVTESLSMVIHKSFINAIDEITSRGAVRGRDYEIFSLWQPDGWHLQARIDRHFISEEDVINE